MPYKTGIVVFTRQIVRRWKRTVSLIPRLTGVLALYIFYSLFRKPETHPKPFGRCSLSVGNFKDKMLNRWNLEEYEWHHVNQPTLFFGMYSLLDFFDFRFHTGQSFVFWCGSDILIFWNFSIIRGLLKKQLSKATHYCENTKEQELLKHMGIEAIICPVVLEDPANFPVTYRPNQRPDVFLSAHPDREEEYGVGLVEKIAPKVPEVTFHIYGVGGKSKHINVMYHGRVSPEQFNKEIPSYQAALRTNEVDGASEIMMKSILLGQWPITRIAYPHVSNYKNEQELIRHLKNLRFKRNPNFASRTFYLKQKLNRTPF